MSDLHFGYRAHDDIVSTILVSSKLLLLMLNLNGVSDGRITKNKLQTFVMSSFMPVKKDMEEQK